MSPFPYYKSLDGVRGIAVLMVILIHSHLMPFGWVGVQIFFVLSGFLITGILLTQTDRPLGLFMRRFYWRRGLRIWPLYFLFVGLCALAYVLVGIPENWRAAWPWLFSFTYNFARLIPNFHDSDYFGHFWTLCVEEQFYLVWPFAVFFLSLRNFRRMVLFLVLAGPLLRYLTGLFIASHFDGTYSISRAVHNLPTSHLDAFAWGGLLAVAPVEWRQRIAPWSMRILLIALTITVGAGLLQSCAHWRHGLRPHWLALGYGDLGNLYQYVWAYSLINLTSAALILCAIEDTIVSRWLSFRPLAYIGTISYGVYLWHLPFLHLFVVYWPATFHSVSGLVRFAVYFLVTLGVATTSYYCFEKYFLSMKKLTLASILKPKPALQPPVAKA